MPSGSPTRRAACSRTCRSRRSRSACSAASRTIAAIAEVVSDYPEIPLVLDPVLASGRGDELATERWSSAMRELLVPQTTIITPNSLEARRLALDDGDDDDDPDLAECARRLLASGCEYVLDHRHAREHAAGRQHALRAGRRRAQRQLAAPARQLSRLGLHARLGDRGDHRQRPARSATR